MAASILWGMPCRLSQVCSNLSEQLFIEYCCLSASTPQRGGMLHLGVKTLAQTTAVHTCCLLALANGGALMLLGERWSFCTKPNKRHVMDSTLHSTAACKGAGGHGTGCSVLWPRQQLAGGTSSVPGRCSYVPGRSSAHVRLLQRAANLCGLATTRETAW